MTTIEKIRSEVLRYRNKSAEELGVGFLESDKAKTFTNGGVAWVCERLLAFLDTLPEQPVEYPTSTEMITEWENNELPMLREKDFRGDAERMAYNAFMDGFAKGLGYKK